MKRTAIVASARALVAGCGLALVAGCSLMPEYNRPAAPVAAAFPYPSATTGTPAPQLPWQQFFPDERLRQLIDIALANNRDMRVAVLNVQAAREQITVRRADLFPTVGGVVNYSHQSPAASGVPPTLYTAGIAVSSWELDLFGRIRSSTAAATAQYLATDEGRKAAQMALVAGVANAWLTIISDEQLLEITQQTLKTREDSLRLTRLRFENGAASELDFRQAQSLYESSRVALFQIQRSRATDMDALSLLIGQPLPADFSTPKGMDAIVFPDVPAGVPSEVLTARPDVRQAEELLKAANANIGVARAAYFPHLALTAEGGRASTTLAGLFGSGGAWAWSIAPQLAMTLFDAGRNTANVNIANVSRDIAVAQYEKAIQSAFRDVADALAGRATFDDQLTAERNVVEAESVRFRLSQMRYDNGVASYLDLLDSQRTLFTAQVALVQTRLAQLQTQVLLYKALGGGWTEPATAANSAATQQPG